MMSLFLIANISSDGPQREPLDCVYKAALLGYKPAIKNLDTFDGMFNGIENLLDKNPPLPGMRWAPIF
jgi:hypothetical protein